MRTKLSCSAEVNRPVSKVSQKTSVPIKRPKRRVVPMAFWEVFLVLGKEFLIHFLDNFLNGLFNVVSFFIGRVFIKGNQDFFVFPYMMDEEVGGFFARP